MILPGIYCQRDQRWAAAELGYNNDPYYNMYHFGCLVTAISNVMWDAGYGPDPGAVNQWLKDNQGFEAGGGNVIWSVAHTLMNQAQLAYVSYSSNLDEVNAFLQADDNYAICQLTKPGFPMHFSASPYVGQIEDSWDGQLKPTASYSFVGAHLYTKAQPVPAPTPLPAPVAPTIIAPLPDPTPAPVNSTPEVTVPEAAPDPVSTPHENVQVTGQASGDVNVRPYGYTPWASPRDKTLQRDAFAKDITGNESPVEFKKGASTKLAGELTYEGKKYYRGSASADKGTWYCIESEAYDNTIESAFLGAFQEVEAVWNNVGKTAKTADPLAALLRWIGRNNKKG